MQTEAAAPVVFPTIHLNGSGAGHLAAGYGAIAHAIGEAIKLATEEAPNARDYDEAGYRLARAQHDDRLALLDRLRGEYLALLWHCRKAMRERTG